MQTKKNPPYKTKTPKKKSLKKILRGSLQKNTNSRKRTCVFMLKNQTIPFIYIKVSVFLSKPYGQCLQPLLQQCPLFRWYFSVKTLYPWAFK